MALKNYQCSKCGTLVQKEVSPTLSGCPKSGNHSWHGLGDIGTNTYQCKKCSTLAKSKSNPTLSGCPSSGNHSWTKL